MTFDGTPPASFSVLNDTSIQAVSPAGPANTTANIRVSTLGGSSEILAGDRYTYGP